MRTEEQILIDINDGFNSAKSNPMEFLKSMSEKMKEFAKTVPDSKWQGLSKGFELGLIDRLKNRQQELKKVKKGRGKSKGRTR